MNAHVNPETDRIKTNRHIFMLRFAKHFAGLALLLLGLQSGFAFSLLGPVNEAYQAPVIGYDLPGRDIGAPKAFDQGYRWNTPDIFYGFDEAFLNYFGSNGVAAVEEAIAMLNDLTNTPFASLNINDFPTESMRINPRAQVLHLQDVKSYALHFIIEELGLTEPDRYSWTLRARVCTPCPSCTYGVIMRNYDPLTFLPSAYVNGRLYTYRIFEDCAAPDPEAITVNVPVNQTDQEFSSLMSLGISRYGAYATSIDRDTIGGLRYLYSTNRVQWEVSSSTSEIFATNRLGTQQILVTSNLSALAFQALTNDAVGLEAQFPGLVISDTRVIGFTNYYVTNITAVLTNFPTQPHGSFTLVFLTNRTGPFFTPIYSHTFENLVTFMNTDGGVIAIPLRTLPAATNRAFVTVETTYFTNSPWGTVYDLPFLVSKRQTFLTNDVVGEYAILPTNSCDVKILGTLWTYTNAYTNFVITATNSILGTNVSTGTGGAGGVGGVTDTNTIPGVTNVGAQLTQSIITYSTNRAFVTLPVTCVGTNITQHQGMNGFRFIRVGYDSLTGRDFTPFTNVYSLIEVTNSRYVTNWYRRVVSQPDIRFTAGDMNATFILRSDTASNFRTNSRTLSLAGPGNIDPNIVITFNSAEPYVINVENPTIVDEGLTESTAAWIFGAGTNFAWGWYDGSGREPIVFPQGTSLRDLENMLVFQIVTADLPVGALNVPYEATLAVTGGQAPYTWAPSADSAPLPAGLTLNAMGTITGTPTAAGVYPITVSVTEAGSRVTTRKLILTIQ